MLLPYSRVSLVFTGIAVSILTVPAPEYAKIIQGTIVVAAFFITLFQKLILLHLHQHIDSIRIRNKQDRLMIRHKNFLGIHRSKNKCVSNRNDYTDK